MQAGSQGLPRQTGGELSEGAESGAARSLRGAARLCRRMSFVSALQAGEALTRNPALLTDLRSDWEAVNPCTALPPAPSTAFFFFF